MAKANKITKSELESIRGIQQKTNSILLEIAKIKKIESSLAEKQRHTPSKTYGLNSTHNQS